jgi:hypothetical protein
MFAQDDWYHLYQIQGKDFCQVLNYFNIFQNGKIEPLNFYRPLATEFYFYLTFHLFNLNPLFYRLVNIFLFLILVLLANKLTRKLIALKISFWSPFFYVFSLANFTLISYLAQASALILGIFTFASILAWLNKKRLFSLIFFVLALMSRESATIIPLAIILIELLLGKQHLKKTISLLSFHFCFLFIYLLTRTFIYGWPKDRHYYQISLFGPHVFKNIFKYLQWNLNLSGLLVEKNLFSWLNLLAFLIMLGLIVKTFKKMKPAKVIFFAAAWWLVFLSPVLFLADHRDPWNLIVANLGMAIIFSQVMIKLKRKEKLIFITSYSLIFLLGLNFYLKNHWTSQRSKLIKKTIKQVESQCQREEIIIQSKTKEELKELEYAWYRDLGPRVLCHNKSLKVSYSLIENDKN